MMTIKKTFKQNKPLWYCQSTPHKRQNSFAKGTM